MKICYEKDTVQIHKPSYLYNQIIYTHPLVYTPHTFMAHN